MRFHPEEECMVEMIKRHFMRLPNWEAEMKKQYEAQFPFGWEEQEEERKRNDSKALNEAFQAIAKIKLANNGDYSDAAYAICEVLCESVLIRFRNHLDDQIKNQIFKTGFHSNDYLLEEALKLYDANFAALGIIGKVLKTNCAGEKLLDIPSVLRLHVLHKHFA